MERVMGIEPTILQREIVDTSTFLRNADWHLTCIFIFSSKLAPYVAHILPVFLRRFSEDVYKRQVKSFLIFTVQENILYRYTKLSTANRLRTVCTI